MDVIVRTESAPALTLPELAALARLELSARAEPHSAADLAATIAMSTPYVLSWKADELAADQGMLLRGLATWLAWGLPPRMPFDHESSGDYAHELLSLLGVFAQWRSRDRATARMIGREVRRFARDEIISAGLARARPTGLIGSPEWPSVAARAMELASMEPRPDASRPYEAGALSPLALGALTSLLGQGSLPAAPTPTNLPRAIPPPPPYYVPNACSPWPLCKWPADDGNTLPTLDPFGNGNTAIDVRGIPWVAQSCKGPFGSYDADPAFAGTCTRLDPAVCPNKDAAYWRQADWSTGPSLIDQIESTITKYIIPIAISIAGAAVGGIGGAALAFALEAAWNIARGQRVDAAVISAYQDRLATELEKTTLAQTYKAVVSAPMSVAAIQELKQTGIADKALSTFQLPNYDQAFNVAVSLARGQQLQDAALAAMRLRCTDEQAGWLDNAIAHGVSLEDWSAAMFGKQGREALQASVVSASRNLDAGLEALANFTNGVPPPIGTLPLSAMHLAPSAISPAASRFAATPFAAQTSAAKGGSSTGGGGGAILAIAALGALALTSKGSR